MVPIRKDELYTGKFSKGTRSYFFDICKSEQDDLYLRVSESKRSKTGFKHHRIMIFEEDLIDFSNELLRTLEKFKTLRDNKNLAGSNISSPPHSKKNMKAF
jgi:hypothetical protein